MTTTTTYGQPYTTELYLSEVSKALDKYRREYRSIVETELYDHIRVDVNGYQQRSYQAATLSANGRDRYLENKIAELSSILESGKGWFGEQA